MRDLEKSVITQESSGLSSLVFCGWRWKWSGLVLKSSQEGDELKVSLCDSSICSFVCSGFSSRRTQQLVWIAAQGTSTSALRSVSSWLVPSPLPLT